MVFNATFNNMSVTSWRSVLLMEETTVHGENHNFSIQISFHSIHWFWRRFSKISNFHSIRSLDSYFRWQVQSLDTTLEEDDPMSIMRNDIGHGMAKDLVS